MNEVRDLPRCPASSWRGKPHRPYGPGGFNRCVKDDDNHTLHEDSFGNVFRSEPFKVMRHG